MGSVARAGSYPVEVAELAANQAVQIQYKYVMESELTDAEKAMVVKVLPKFVEKSIDTYYLVYRPKKQGGLTGNLPSTGYSGMWEAIFATAGLVLAVLVISKGKNGKRYLSSVLLVTGIGSILLSPSILAVTNIELAAYNQLLNSGLGEQLTQPLDIEDFEYVGYLSLSLFSPIYSALSNPTGAPGDVMFRRTAYELLAAKGYHEGFVPYVSGKFSEEALKEGSTTWDGWFGKDVGLVTDQKVLENVFKGEYDSWVSFKKAMYQGRINQLTKLKPITIEYELRNPNSTKKVTIRSYKDMQRLMDEALAEDVRNIDNATSRVEASWVNLLKKKIYNAYLRTTDDFRQSIFTK